MTIQDVLLILVSAWILVLTVEIRLMQKNMIMLAREMDGFEERLNQIVRAK